MVVKITVAILLIWMAYNLFLAMKIMLKGEQSKESMTRFIGRRVLTSAVIMLLLILAIVTGIITPNPRPY